MKIRVLEVLATLKRAGAEQVAVALARGLDRQRFETALVSLFDPFPGGLEPALEEAGVRTWHLGKRRGFDPRMYPRLARVMREYAPDVVHTHSYVLRYVLPVVGRRRVVHTVHNLADREVDWIGRMLHRLAFRRKVAAVAIGPAVARSFRAVYGRDPTAVIANGIDGERYRRPEARAPWRRAHGFHEDDVLYVSVARLDPQKNPLGLIDAFARTFRGEAHRHLLMAGTGSLAERARRLAAERGLERQVHFLGVRSDVPELLSACDVFVLASLWEGSPLAVLEARAAGLPVVATSVGGVPELVGEAGVVVPPGDAGALAEALRREPGKPGCLDAYSTRAMVEAYAGLFS
jgi:glycosyltransferase involved in cell wall biosynthesis